MFRSNKLLTICLLLVLAGCKSEQKTEEKPRVEYDVPSHLSKSKTVYYLISHAPTKNKKTHDSTELNEQGFEQAAFWGNYFSDKDLDLFYTTPETFAFQTMIPIVHPYKGQIRNIDDKLKFSQPFWKSTYSKNVVVISKDLENISFVNNLLNREKYHKKDLKNKRYLFKLTIDDNRFIKDSLFTF